MEQMETHKAVKDGLESKLREYALNPFVKVEICIPSEAEGCPQQGRVESNGFVSE